MSATHRFSCSVTKVQILWAVILPPHLGSIKETKWTQWTVASLTLFVGSTLGASGEVFSYQKILLAMGVV